MTYKIENGIPMAARRASRERKYPVREMRVGDSFLVPERDAFANVAQSVRNIGADHGFKIASRKTSDGVRFWRIK